MTDIDPHEYERWSASGKQRAVEILEQQRQARDQWRPWYCPDPACDGKPHGDWQWGHCRADQRPPDPNADWFTWCMRGGRGSGKSIAGAQWVRRMTSYVSRIALVARTSADFRDTMIEGETGILSVCPPDMRPTWEPSKRRLTFPNGSIVQAYSGEEPDRLRGPQFGAAWMDEPAHYALIGDVWDNLRLGLRLGKRPRVCATTTPRPTKWMRELIADPTTVDVRVSTYENLDNLAPSFRATVLDRFEGTRMGKQELYGDILEDVDGALWNIDMIEPNRVSEAPEMDRIVVAIDPAGTANRRSDETGIVVVGKRGDHAYVLADHSGRYSPNGWARRADIAYDEFSADAIVYETNYGGEMVQATLQGTGTTARLRPVHSRRGKAIRAEPIVSKYEQQKILHVGVLDALETEMVSWVPGEGDSPNRVDALVHGATELLHVGGVMEIASPTRRRTSA